MKPSFAIVGCGKVGTTLGKFLAASGYTPAGLSSKSLASAEKAAVIIGTKCFSDTPWEVTSKADLVFITTPDDAIQETCDRISQKNGFKKNAVVFHCSGALPSTILGSAQKGGAFIGSMHPLQSFASFQYDENPFQGIIVTVEGDTESIKQARRIITDIGAEGIEITTDGKTLYHAAAVAVSNYLVTLVDLSFSLIKEAGISGRDALNILKPLIDGTLANIESMGIPGALTGPIARGDVKTVKDHIAAMESKTPGLLSLYKTLGRFTVDIATAKGTLSESSAEILKDLLGPDKK